MKEARHDHDCRRARFRANRGKRAARSAPAATDRFAFAAVLDSLPGAEAKAGSSVDGDQSPASNEPKQGEASLGQPDFHSILLSLPFAFLPASAPHEGAAAAVEASPLAPASTLGLRPEDNGASNVADADPTNPAAVGRLVGERAFHISLSTSGNVLAERPPTVGPPALAPTPASGHPDRQGAGAPIGPSSLAGTAFDARPSAGRRRRALRRRRRQRHRLSRSEPHWRKSPSRQPPVGPQRDGDTPRGGRAVLERDIGVRADCSPRQWIVGKPIRQHHPTGGAKSRPRRPEIRSRSVAIGRPDCEFGCPRRPCGAERQGRRRSARSDPVRRAVRGAPEARSARRRRRLSLRGRRSDLMTCRREPRTSRHARARFPLPEPPRPRPSRRSTSISRLAAWRTPP